jgi:pilus assembly protein CpaE
MFPLNAVLVGCPPDLVPELRRLLAEHGVRVEAECPYVRAAVNRLAVAPPGARLFVFYLAEDVELADLRQLRAAFVGQPILALLAPRADHLLLVSAVRAGASQALAFPPQGDELRLALDGLGLQFGYAAGAQGLTVAVQSVTGGCGATTLAINLADELARRQKRCVLAELSLHFGVLSSLLEVKPRLTTHQLFGDLDHLDLRRVESALVPFGERLRVLAGPEQLAPPLLVGAPDVLRLVGYLRRLSDVVVVDLPSSFEDLYFDVLAAADHFVMVGEQRVSSVRALRLYHETVERDPLFQRPTLTKHFVLNRYDPKRKGFEAEGLRELLGLWHLVTVADDPAGLAEAANKGRTLRQHSPHSRARAGLGDLTDRVLAGEAPAPRPRSGALSRLVRVFRL